MKTKIIALLILAVSSICQLKAQDTIMLMKGKRIFATNHEVKISPKGDTILYYQLINGKQKHKKIDKIFSVYNNTNKEYFYTPDTAIGIATINDMEQFLNGMADHQKGFSWGAYAGGIASMWAAMAIPSIGFGSGDNRFNIWLGPVVPYAYLLIVSNTTRSVEKIKAQNPDINPNEFYLYGVQSAISKRRLRDGVLGIITGGLSFGFVL